MGKGPSLLRSSQVQMGTAGAGVREEQKEGALNWLQITNLMPQNLKACQSAPEYAGLVRSGRMRQQLDGHAAAAGACWACWARCHSHPMICMPMLPTAR